VSNNRPSRNIPRRAWSRGLRWAGVGAPALLAAGVLLIAPSTVRSAIPAAHADNCPDVAVTFARGTDEPTVLGRVGQALVDSLRQASGKNIDAYAVNYRATLLQLHGNDGAKDAINHIKSVADKCPNTPQVLGGYSQGASVVDIVSGVSIGGIGWGSSLPPEYAKNVIAVTTFGNPADRSGGPISQQSQMFAAKAVDYCNPEDPICHAGAGNEWKGHTDGYVPVYTSQAASFVQTRLLSVLSPTAPGGPNGIPPGPLGVPPGPAPGPGPGDQGTSVIDQTQPTSFH
jgi:cutinase